MDFFYEGAYAICILLMWPIVGCSQSAGNPEEELGKARLAGGAY